MSNLDKMHVKYLKKNIFLVMLPLNDIKTREMVVFNDVLHFELNHITLYEPHKVSPQILWITENVVGRTLSNAQHYFTLLCLDDT